MRAWLVVGLVVAGLVSLMGCSQQQAAETEFEVVVRKDGDMVETATSTSSGQAVVDDTVIFDIYSQIGIGDAEVKLTKGEWPETISFRVHLMGLEEFKFAYGETVVTASVSSSGENLILESVSQNGEEQPISVDSSYYMPIRIESENSELGIPLEDGYFEIDAPVDFFAGAYDGFAISWVDFYR